MIIDKHQMSMLTFDLLAKVAHIGLSSIYLNIFISETIGQMEVKFHMNK